MRAGDWIILECGGKATIGLAQSLREDGIDAWTPIERRMQRYPRSKERREVIAPIIPTLVFVRAVHETALLALARSPSLLYQVYDPDKRRMVTKGHARFRVFRHYGQVPRVADASLAPLRALEGRTAPKAPLRVFGVGSSVRVPEGGFAGMPGTVQGTRGKFTMVQFDGLPFAVQISTRLLHGALDDDSGHGVDIGTNGEAGASRVA